MNCMDHASRKPGSRKPAGKQAALESGVIVVDKPEGETSAAVVNRLKRLSGIYKAGHTGTLDPFATGVLICPVNRATRLSRFFLRGRKKYNAVLRLGAETDTLDRTGEITAEHRIPDLSEEEIRRIIKGYTGRIEQVPPAYSALKHNGVPLYKYARKGKPVYKPARTVEIYEISVKNIDLPEISIEVSCSGGTYIRTLCSDIGRSLGCGGYLNELVRIESCGFGIDEAASLSSLEAVGTAGELQRFVIPMAEALRGMQAHVAGPELTEKIRFGRPVSEADLGGKTAGPENENSAFVKIVDNNNRLLAVIEKEKDKFEYSYCCVFQSG
ncbi:MAG: tRNA pseudouridine(55) synthase TruB [Desulfobacterales bacterium]|nr:tRNA pseudouridine(55) synthase TruB [Desulfobacterales bacterium]